MPRPTGARALRRLFAVSATIATATALTFAGTSAAQADDHTSFPGSKPSWATTKNDVGAPTVDDLLNGQIQLRLRDETGAEALAQAVSTPGGPLYRHDLTPSAWIARFSPTKEEYARVVAYVKSYGFTITATPKSRLFVNYRGTATQMNSAFSAGMRNFRYDGKTMAAPSKAPQLPTSLAADTQAVSLAQVHHVVDPVTATTNTAKLTTKASDTPVTVPAPCSQYYGQHAVRLPAIDGQSVFPTGNCGYTAAQLRSAYKVSGDGAGQTIGEVLWGVSPTIQSDVNRWAAAQGVPPLTTLKQILTPQINEEACDSTDPIEESLDIETMHGLAPKAKIVFSAAADCDFSIDAALSVILDDHLSSVVSNSYSYIGGEPTIDMVQAELHQQLQAAAEGIGLYYSTGDYGDNTPAGFPATANYYATSPWVTAVGGTTTEIGRNGQIAAQTGWGNQASILVKDSSGALTYDPPFPGVFDGASGGGVSTLFAEPWYQRGIVPAGLSKGFRAEPDISADGDNYTGLLTSWTDPASGTFLTFPVGGTSLSSPLVATEMALVQQQSGCAIGFANPLLYRLAASHANAVTDVRHEKIDVADTFTDSTTGLDLTEVDFGDHDTSLTTTPGWDDVTGLGSFSVAGLASAVRR